MNIRCQAPSLLVSIGNSGFINRRYSVTKSSAIKFFLHKCISRTISEFLHLKRRNKTNLPETTVAQVLYILLFPLMKVITYLSYFQVIFTSISEGFIYLTNGWMRHLTTAFRNGEAHVQLDGDLVHITTDIEFNSLIVSYVTPNMISNQFRELNLTVKQAYRRLLRLGEPSLNYRHFESNFLYLHYLWFRIQNRT